MSYYESITELQAYQITEAFMVEAKIHKIEQDIAFVRAKMTKQDSGEPICSGTFIKTLLPYDLYNEL